MLHRKTESVSRTTPQKMYKMVKGLKKKVDVMAHAWKSSYQEAEAEGL
jgi:hypothetical protein